MDDFFFYKFISKKHLRFEPNIINVSKNPNVVQYKASRSKYKGYHKKF